MNRPLTAADLEAYWMAFTANRSFEKRPRIMHPLPREIATGTCGWLTFIRTAQRGSCATACCARASGKDMTAPYSSSPGDLSRFEACVVCLLAADIGFSHVTTVHRAASRP